MTSTGARDQILKRIGDALSHRADGEPAIGGDDYSNTGNEAHARCVAQSDFRVEQFERELTSVGGVFCHAANAAGVCDQVLRIASAHKARKVIAWEAAFLHDIALSTSLAEAGIEFLPGSAGVASDFRVAATADIGITGVDYALADTGTLVLRSGGGRARSVSLLPPVHIALLKHVQILSGLDDLFPLLARDNKAGGRPDSALTFITGPSRTADIELTMVVGVHGPQELHVILLDEDDNEKEGN